MFKISNFKISSKFQKYKKSAKKKSGIGKTFQKIPKISNWFKRLEKSEFMGLYICMPKYHFLPKVLAGCQSFGSEFWQGKNVPKVSAQNFMPKFRAEILSQNFGTMPKLLAWNILAWNFGTKNMPKFFWKHFRHRRLFRHADV